MVYQEIIEGCSDSNKGYFVKHLCELEQIELVRKRAYFISRYKEQGIPVESERLAQIIESGEWNNTHEGDILAYRVTIMDNEKILPTVIPVQQMAIRRAIQDNRDALVKLLISRRMAIGTTAEELAEKDSTYFMAYISLYQNRECDKPLFSHWEAFDDLEEHEQEPYIKSIEETMAKFKEANIRRISALPFFLNPFSYSKDAVHTFLNKPMCRLTNYQVHLFSMGSRNLNILNQTEGSPPEYFEKTSADEILQWYDRQYSVIIGKRKMSTHS